MKFVLDDFTIISVRDGKLYYRLDLFETDVDDYCKDLLYKEAEGVDISGMSEDELKDFLNNYFLSNSIKYKGYLFYLPSKHIYNNGYRGCYESLSLRDIDIVCKRLEQELSKSKEDEESIQAKIESQVKKLPKDLKIAFVNDKKEYWEYKPFKITDKPDKGISMKFEFIECPAIQLSIRVYPDKIAYLLNGSEVNDIVFRTLLKEINNEYI